MSDSRWDDVTRLAWYRKTVEQNPWIKAPVHPKQRLFLTLSDVREVFFGGSGGGGKALSLDTPIPTPTGWTTMGELKAGDTVFGADGKPCLVLYNSGVMYNHRCFRVTFDDQSSVIADAEHLWKTYTATDLIALKHRTPEFRVRRQAKRPSVVLGNKSDKFTASLTLRNKNRVYRYVEPPKPGIRTTAEIAATLYHRPGPKQQANHAIPQQAAIDLPDSDLPLDPYLLGVWLGDGTANDGGITSADPEIPAAFTAAGFEVRKSKARYRWGTIGLARILRQLGLKNNKHVPAAYLRGSRAQRLALLQGLMDTDGTVCSHGQVEFCNTNKRLAEGVYELAVSLGHKVRLREGVAKLNGQVIGPKWTLKWTTPDPVFRLPRKLNKQKRDGFRATSKYRYIVACEPVESVPVCCIKVDNADSMFLCGRSMVSTHNSHCLWFAALQYVNVPTYAALILRRSYAELAKPGALMDRSKTYLSAINAQLPENERAKWNETNKQWTFPSGATITFGHMESENSKYNYASSEYSLIAFDELTTFTETQYTFLFSRLRKPKDGPLKNVPLRMRSASNPGAIGHQWVFKRFVDPKTRKLDTVFLPASMKDNPSLDIDEYRKSLADTDPITRARIEKGDWNAAVQGKFLREWFQYYRREGEHVVLLDSDRAEVERFNPWHRPRWQTYDPSASGSDDADCYTVSTWCLSPRANLVWLACRSERSEVPEQVNEVKKLYRRWKPQFVAVEEVLNQRAHAQLLRRSTDPVVNVMSVSPLGKEKAVRAVPASVFVASKRLYLPEDDRSFPLEDVETQLTLFTGEDGVEDGIADSLFYAISCVSKVFPHAGQPGADAKPSYYDPLAPKPKKPGQPPHTVFRRPTDRPRVVGPWG